MIPITEQRNPRSTGLDAMDTLEIVTLITEEEATVASAVRAALPAIARAAELAAQALRSGGRVCYLGCGTSGRLGALDAAEWEPTFGVPPGVVEAITASAAGLEDDPARGAHDVMARRVGPLDVVVGLAASGRTPYVLGGLRAARQGGAATVGICCVPDAPMSALVDAAVVAVVGPEVLTGSTRMKAGTAQKMILNMISTAAMVRLGKVYDNLMVDLRPVNEKLVDRAHRIIAEAAAVSLRDAAQLLQNAGGEVKPAIVMAALRCDRATALQRLARAGGVLRQALEER